MRGQNGSETAPGRANCRRDASVARADPGAPPASPVPHTTTLTHQLIAQMRSRRVGRRLGVGGGGGRVSGVAPRGPRATARRMRSALAAAKSVMRLSTRQCRWPGARGAATARVAPKPPPPPSRRSLAPHARPAGVAWRGIAAPRRAAAAAARAAAPAAGVDAVIERWLARPCERALLSLARPPHAQCGPVRGRRPPQAGN